MHAVTGIQDGPGTGHCQRAAIVVPHWRGLHSAFVDAHAYVWATLMSAVLEIQFVFVRVYAFYRFRFEFNLEVYVARSCMCHFDLIADSDGKILTIVYGYIVTYVL